MLLLYSIDNKQNATGYKKNMIKLRDYQARDIAIILDHFNNGADCVLYVLPTGGGKTVTFAEVIRRRNEPTLVIAHRQELVTQISMALCAVGIAHGIEASSKTVKNIIKKQVRKYGRAFYDPRSDVRVAGVDTMIRAQNDTFYSRVKFVVQDEGHHVLQSNKWGTAAKMCPNAQMLLVTATPERADGAGLGRHASGFADVLVEGPTMQQLIDAGYLTPFKIVGIPNSIMREESKVGASGDFTLPSMRKAFEKSGLVGDIVRHYLKFTPGLRGVTFVPDVADAHRVAKAFNDAGVPAVALHGNTPDDERNAAIDDFEAGRIKQIVNVDLLGEGFDCPGIEVVQFARPTESYAVYAQQFGRALRVLDGKNVAWIIDHVGNVLRHGGPPTQYREWTLDGRTKGKNQQGPTALRYCDFEDCAAPFFRFLTACPFCGKVPDPPKRSDPVFVDGDLVLLDPQTLEALMAEVAQENKTLQEKRAELAARRVPEYGVNNALAAHRKRLAAVNDLIQAMQQWGGHVQHARGISRRDAQKLFFLTYGVDVLSAQKLDRTATENLTAKIIGDLLDGITLYDRVG